VLELEEELKEERKPKKGIQPLPHWRSETVSRQKKWTLIRIRKPLGNGLTKNAGWTTSGHRHCALLGLLYYTNFIRGRNERLTESKTSKTEKEMKINTVLV